LSHEYFYHDFLSIRHFRHVKKRAKAKKALTRLRTIANKLIRELQRKLPTHSLFETYQKDFLFYQQVAVFNLFNLGSAL
jgi:IS5 family transposase